MRGSKWLTSECNCNKKSLERLLARYPKEMTCVLTNYLIIKVTQKMGQTIAIHPVLIHQTRDFFLKYLNRIGILDINLICKIAHWYEMELFFFKYSIFKKKSFIIISFQKKTYIRLRSILIKLRFSEKATKLKNKLVLVFTQ